VRQNDAAASTLANPFAECGWDGKVHVANRPRELMQQTRHIHFIVGALLVAVVGLAGSLLAIPLLIGDPLQVVRPGAPTALANMEDGAPASLHIRVGGSGDFLLLVAREQADDPPLIRFDMPNHDMPPVEAEVDLVRDGLFQATGRLDMPGRWRIAIAFDDVGDELEFMLAEF
jgi:hypothetical protein